MNLVDALYKVQDRDYANFNHKLIPTIKKECMIGVRVPMLRKIAKEYGKEKDCLQFLHTVPHTYFEENMIHSLLIGQIKEYEACIQELNHFLPYVDNWAVCDTITNPQLKKHRKQLMNEILRWIQDKHPYSVRFGIRMLMVHYLDEDFKEEYLNLVSNIRSEEYYVNMMIAWYFATALAKQWESAIKVLEFHTLSPWVHNKTIQKAVESYRISNEQKDYLKTLKR